MCSGAFRMIPERLAVSPHWGGWGVAQPPPWAQVAPPPCNCTAASGIPQVPKEESGRGPAVTWGPGWVLAMAVTSEQGSPGQITRCAGMGWGRGRGLSPCCLWPHRDMARVATCSVSCVVLGFSLSGESRVEDWFRVFPVKSLSA